MKRYSTTAGVLMAAAVTFTVTGCNSTTASGPVTVTVSAPDTSAPGATDAPGSGNPGGTPGSAGSADGGRGTGNNGSGIPTSAADPGTRKCNTSQLTLDKGVGGKVGGHWFLKFINNGTSSCVMQGFPGVSYTNGANGDPVGEPADRDQTTPSTRVTLGANGGAAQFEFIEDSDMTNHCGNTLRTDTLRVYPPDNTESLTLWWPHIICPSPQHMLSVRAVTPM